MRRLEPEEIEKQIFPIARRGYEKDKVDSFLRVVAEFYRGALRAAEAAETRAVVPERPVPERVVPERAVPRRAVPERVVPEPPAPRPSFDRLGDQIASVLSTAEKAAEELKTTAEREAQHMRRTAADEAAETTQAATNQLALARQLKANAQQEAETTLAEARDEASRVKQEAHVVAARLEQNARERAAKVEQSAEGKLDEVVAEARRRYEQLSSASQQSVDHILSVESLLRKAREELTLERLTTKEVDFPPDGPVGFGTGGEPLRSGGVAEDGEDAEAGSGHRESMPAEEVVPSEGEAAFSTVPTYGDDPKVDEAARQVDEMSEALGVEPAPLRRRGTSGASGRKAPGPSTGARTRSPSRRTGPKN